MISMTDTNITTGGTSSDSGAGGSVVAPAAAYDAGAIAAAVQLLADHPDHRILRRISEATLPLAADDTDTPTRIGVVVDVETEGLDPARDAIVELAMRRFRFDAAGRIVAVGATRVWHEDPGRPLDPAITRLTGLTDADLAGQTIDEAAATAMLRTADVVVAHNARFDRPRVEARLPDGAGRPWACALYEVDWDALAFDGRRLGHLLMQSGWFHDGHRAAADILALLHLLAHRCSDNTTVLGRLIARAEAPSVRIEARGAAFALKDALKARGYRWHVAESYWWTEVAEADLIAEQLWLQRRGCRPPQTVPVTWTNRHR
jgi:DNA polymerase-3 subunit epsilon